MGPTALRHCIRAAVAFLVMFVMCSLKFSFSSKVMPRNLAEVDSVSGVSFNVIGFVMFHFLFHVNFTIFVLRALMSRPLLLHHCSMVLSDFWVMSRRVLVSGPVIRESRSSANACR